MKKLYFYFIIIIFYSLNLTAQTEYFIDPINGSNTNSGISSFDAFYSLEKAKEIVRNQNTDMDEDIIIYLMEGNYVLDSTFVLSEEDGGTNGFSIIYQAYDCQKPVISGGYSFSGWTVYDTNKNIYKAYVGANIASRQLYVNGKRAVRARSTDANGWTDSGDGYDCPIEVSNWENVSQVEVVSYKNWKCHRGAIASISGTHAVMNQPYWNNLHNHFDAPPVWIENAYELLDEEGEWYLDYDTDTMYYKPISGENIQVSTFIIPRVETLVYCNNLNNVQFNGLSFEYASWNFPNSSNGFVCGQADVIMVDDYEDLQMSGNVRFTFCSNIQINYCNFSHLGSTGLQFFEGCKNNIVYNSTFTDISASGISVASVSKPFSTIEELVKDNRIENNFIRDVAIEYKSCVGIFVGYTEGIKIKNNEIRNLPYSGISMGWGWSSSATDAKNNEISYNLIDSVMTDLNDGGAIYTLGAQAGTQVHHNYLKNQLNINGALYLDQGSTDMHWHNNVISNAPWWLNIGVESVQNDTVDFNYHDVYTSLQNGTNCVIENNVYVDDGNWPQEAIDIMNGAGRHDTPDCIPENTLTENVKVDESNITLYPNPANSIVHIVYDNITDSEKNIKVFDILGNLLIEKNSSQTTIDINIEELVPNLYIVQINLNNSIYNVKFVKE